MALLDISGLALSIGERRILNDLTFSIAAGETLGLVGESGSGKSLTALSLMRLAPRQAALSGRIALAGANLLDVSEPGMCAIRGRDIAMIFQEPMSALNPAQTIGRQIGEPFRAHCGASSADASGEARRLMEKVGLGAVGPDRYAHELSGGQRQRAVIAMAIALRPKLLIADEPTTALDVTAQADIVALLRALTDEFGAGLLFITHDLPLVAGIADRIAVMQEGRIVETGPVAKVLRKPDHAYTAALLQAARPSGPGIRKLNPSAPIVLAAAGARRAYRNRSLTGVQRVAAVDDVSFSIAAGEALGLVGESGCGKSTLARAMLALESLDAGSVTVAGADLTHAKGAALRRARRNIQIVFQDPYGSFNPRHRVGRIVAEPMRLLSPRPTPAERRAAAARMLTEVGLSPADLVKFPHEFSGGERQRIAIARALIARPSIVVLDEAVSALDASTRAQILALLAELSASLNVAYFFISHDIAVVRAVCDRVLVMKDGRIVDEGRADELFERSEHPYTRRLVAATPCLAGALDARDRDDDASTRSG